MKQKYYVMVITVLLAALVFQQLRLSSSREASRQLELVTDELDGLKSIYHLLYSNTFIQYTAEDMPINNVTGINNRESIDLRSMLNDSVTLVFRYTEHHCNTCVEASLKSLVSYSRKIGIKRILIVTTFRNARTMQIFLNKNAPGIPLFNTNEMLSLPLEDWDTPYFFVTDKNLKARLVFMPAKEINGYADQYLNVIYQRFFQSFEVKTIINSDE